MGYKDKGKQRDYDRERMRKVRQGRTERVEQSGVEQTRVEQTVTDRRVLHLAEALITPQKKAQLLLLSNALNKKVTGMEGKRVNLNSMVRYGVSGFTFDKIKELL